MKRAIFPILLIFVVLGLGSVGILLGWKSLGLEIILCGIPKYKVNELRSFPGGDPQAIVKASDNLLIYDSAQSVLIAPEFCENSSSSVIWTYDFKQGKIINKIPRMHPVSGGDNYTDPPKPYNDKIFTLEFDGIRAFNIEQQKEEVITNLPALGGFTIDKTKSTLYQIKEGTGAAISYDKPRAVVVFNLNTFRIEDEIPIQPLVRYINEDNIEFSDSVIHNIFLDDNGILFVFGGVRFREIGQRNKDMKLLLRIDPTTKEITKVFNVPASFDYGGSIAQNASRSKAFIVTRKQLITEINLTNFENRSIPVFDLEKDDFIDSLAVDKEKLYLTTRQGNLVIVGRENILEQTKIPLKSPGYGGIKGIAVPLVLADGKIFVGATKDTPTGIGVYPYLKKTILLVYSKNGELLEEVDLHQYSSL